MNGIRNVIFDLDGTLVDTAGEIIVHMQAALKAAGVPVPTNIDLSWIGPPLVEILPRIAPNQPPEKLKEVFENFRRSYDASNYEHTMIYPGVPGLLAGLRAKGIPLYVATNKRRVPALRSIEILKLGPFADFISGDSFPPAQLDKTQMVRRLMDSHRLDAASTVLVGDAPSDLRAGRENGMRCVAAAYGYGGIGPLTAAKPDALVRNASELAPILLGLE